VAAGLAAAQARWRADGDARALRRQLLALLQRLDAFDSRGR
jgi:ATP-dependent 26S proteasome regulatory subunit